MKLAFNNNNPGYIALLTVSIVMGVVIIIGITVTMLIATGLLTTFTIDRGTLSYYLADSCAQESLYRIKTEGVAYIGSHTITVNGEDCTITAAAGTGTTVDVAIEGNYNDETYRTIFLEVETVPFTLNSWQEAQ